MEDTWIVTAAEHILTAAEVAEYFGEELEHVAITGVRTLQDRRLYVWRAEQGDAEAQYYLANMHRSGEVGPRDYRAALMWYERAATQGHTAARNELAWLLATCPDGGIRDGGRAVAIAEELVDEMPSLSHHDTLAAAYAESGRFEDALATQRRVVSTNPLFGDALAHLDAYRAGRPWREGGSGQ